MIASDELSVRMTIPHLAKSVMFYDIIIFSAGNNGLGLLKDKLVF